MGMSHLKVIRPTFAPSLPAVPEGAADELLIKKGL